MKLKLVVVSMSVLGLVSCPVFAASETKHTPHHQKVKHHKVVKVVEEAPACASDCPRIIKGPAPDCAIPEATLVMGAMTQNIGRAWPNPCRPGWFERIALSGGINVDIGKWGNRNANFMGENYQRISLNDAYINLAAVVNDWAKAFASISYNNATINDPTFSTNTVHLAEYNAAYDANVISGSKHTLQLEQAFITLGNFDVSPIFVQLGKQFQDFGRYPLHPITESLTQVMSKTLAPSAKLGFFANGFNGSIYAFDDPLPKILKTHVTTNYGAALGYEQPITCDQVGWDIGVAYLYNLIGVNDIAYQVNQFNLNNPNSGETEGYTTRAAGVAAYFDLLFNPFYVNLRYVQATQRFNVNDLPKNGVADLIAGTGAPLASAKGARPWSAGINAGVGFNIWEKPQTIYAGYQTSREAGGLMIPKHRWLVGYGIDVFPSTTVTGEWDHDNGYARSKGGLGRNTNLVSIRAAVKFS